MANTLRYNNTIPDNIYYGGTPVQNVYYNNIKVWSSSPVSGTLAVGNLVAFDNKSWRVVHNDGNKWYLALSEIYSMTEFGIIGSVYKGSTLAAVANTYQTQQLSATALEYCIDVTVHEVTNKVFIPTYAQVVFEFSYYKGTEDVNANRICNYNGNPGYWWILPPGNPGDSRDVYNVNADGTIGNRFYHTNSVGFRPHICIII